MPDINDLQLTEEAIPDVDWEAPESGAFPPRLFPGIYEFIFKLPENSEDHFSVQTVKDKNYLEINWIASVTQASAAGRTVDGQPPEGNVNIPFQRASAFKTPKMRNSFMGELMRCLGLRSSLPLTRQVIADLFRAGDGQVVGKAELNWDAYCKGCEKRVSTSPRTKKGDVPWPRNGDGSYTLEAPCPGCGKKQYGREQFSNYKLPQQDIPF